MGTNYRNVCGQNADIVPPPEEVRDLAAKTLPDDALATEVSWHPMRMLIFIMSLLFFSIEHLEPFREYYVYIYTLYTLMYV